MMVTFVSQCEKKALARTRKVLDAFANRIGNRTWQTAITGDGLVLVRKLLRQTATKNTAVACHWMRSRKRSELIWVVGNHSQFNEQGQIPVNRTQKNLAQSQWENDWHYLPLIKAVIALAALMHDWGKASVLFQSKLERNSRQGDPLRHEWISCLLFIALVQTSGSSENDDAWIDCLIKQQWDEQILKQTILANNANQKGIVSQLPPIASLVVWLILSHHRLPDLKFSDQADEHKAKLAQSIEQILAKITENWGYKNVDDGKDYAKRLQQCFEFKHGLLSQSVQWRRHLKRWAQKLWQEREAASTCLQDGSWRVLLHHARLCLMLGDHYYSSCEQDKNWSTTVPLIANTDKKGHAKQLLDEHLVGVNCQALQVAQSLSRLGEEMESAQYTMQLNKKSPAGFEWQDKAVQAIKQFGEKQQHASQMGWFVVNIASTGKGKTIGNAKVMQALSKDGQSLRYILALGLRTLTLQTGDAYRQGLGLGNDDLAVLIGSKAVQELHQQAKNITESEVSFEDFGSESLEDLLDNELDYSAMPQADFLQALFPERQAEKNMAFLYKPILSCTIDHMMAATETKRGGKYILPCLRLLSSDLVIDEVDDFNGQDLIAIARLVHLAGMLGRKVMISSATIPPALAEGFFNAYQLGWQLYCLFKRQQNMAVACMWLDEFKAKVEAINVHPAASVVTTYQTLHQKFVGSRVAALNKQIVKHKAYIIECDFLRSAYEEKQSDDSALYDQYFELIKQQVSFLHQQHHTVDEKTGKKVSFGVVRMANIPPCVALSQYLLNAKWDEQFEPRVMPYHSRQILLLRSVQEQHLDAVLVRKEKAGQQPAAFANPIIRAHLDNTTAENVLFILVATPVEEVGRDHDFDWAVIEPSSYRSIIQLSGRVLRHRHLKQDIASPNIALMQYNLKGLKNESVAFSRPGFEIDNPSFRLHSKDLKQLLDIENFQKGINATARIQANALLHPNDKLIDLEHAVMQRFLRDEEHVGAGELHGWLHETWFLTALPQRFNAFRQSAPNIKLYGICQDGQVEFYERNKEGDYVKRTQSLQIKPYQLNQLESKRLWFKRDYHQELRKQATVLNNEPEHLEWMMTTVAKRYGEIMLPEYDNNKMLSYSDQFGLVKKNSIKESSE